MYIGNKSCKPPSSNSKSSINYVPSVTNSVGTTHHKPKRKQQYQEQRSHQYWKPIEDDGTKIKRNKVVSKQSIIHKSPFIQHTNLSTIMNPNTMSSNSKRDTGCNLRCTTSARKSSTQHTNVSTLKNPNSSLKNGTMKTSSNAKGTTSKLKPTTSVSKAKNSNTVLLISKSTFTPSCSGTTGKGTYYHNSSICSSGAPIAQHHVKANHSLKNNKEGNEAPKNTG